MQCKEVESVLEQEQIAPLPEEARAHIAGCASCQNLIADFDAIIAAAERMPAEVTPPERIWISLRNQLEAEGIIREQVVAAAPERSSFWQAVAGLFRGRALAIAAVGLIIVLGALVQLRSPSDPVRGTPATKDPLAATADALSEQERDITSMQRVGTATNASNAPVDASLQKNLRELDQFIAECEQHLKQQPQDELAREYLAAAYQQKAELLSAMIDRGRSVN